MMMMMMVTIMTITMMALLEERGKVPHLEISGQHRPAHLVVEYLIMVMMIMIYDHDDDDDYDHDHGM